jgi:crossover junction endodeoxyribonuclease RuvC
LPEPAAFPPAGARVLGIDPGLAATGFGVIVAGARGFDVLAAGVVATEVGLDLPERVHRLYEGVRELLVKHGPGALILEDLYSEYRFPRTALLMAHARGVVCLAARQCEVRILAVAPAEVKRALTGNGGAAKAQVQRGVQHRLGLAELPRPSHVADALALALTGLSRLGGGLDGSLRDLPLRLRRQSRRSNGR